MQFSKAPERDDARAAWRAVCADSSQVDSSQVFEAFAMSFMGRGAAELAAEREHVREALPDAERAALEGALNETLNASREGRAIGQQEAARQALRGAIRYGFDGLARRAAERLCEVQGALDVAHGMRPLAAFLVEAFAGDA